jgi:hypothetical protein
METIITNSIIGATATYLLLGVLILNADKIVDKFIFKVIPFFLGLGLLIIFLKNIGVI